MGRFFVCFMVWHWEKRCCCFVFNADFCWMVNVDGLNGIDLGIVIAIYGVLNGRWMGFTWDQVGGLLVYDSI